MTAPLSLSTALPQGLDAATEMVDAHLSALIAPHWPLPEAVASQPGLQAAVRQKLDRRREAAERRVEGSFESLRAAVGAMRGALEVLREAAAAYGVGPAGAAAAAVASAGANDAPAVPQTPPPACAAPAPAAAAAAAARPLSDVSHVVVFLCLTIQQLGAPES